MSRSWFRTDAMGAERIRLLILAVAICPILVGRADAQVPDPGTSVEGCIGCHAANGQVPVGDISDPSDGIFENLGGGNYRLTIDPAGVSIAAGDTLRGAVEISAGDIPAGNGWCDFDADLVMANNCTTPTALTRDIVQTDTCNGCHGVTSDTKLAFTEMTGGPRSSTA